MDQEKAKKIIRIYNWVRFILLVVLLAFLFIGLSKAQTIDERIGKLEEKVLQQEKKNKYMPQIHGILRGKYEYQPEMEASRFEMRNARLSASGKLAGRSEYKLEVDLCDESVIKMKDAWVSINPWKTLRLTVGQQTSSTST
jgi:hypothetical protein